MRWGCALLWLALAVPAAAHEVRPAYLELRETAPDRYAASFRVPAIGDMRLRLRAELPTACAEREPRAIYATPGAFTERWTIACTGGLAGREVRIDGLEATLTDVLVRIERADGGTQLARLTPSAPAFVVPATPSSLQLARTYALLGVEHILLGVDHLLFVLALLIVVRGARRLVGTITAFTLAHSLTLAGATLGLVHVPQQPVEAVIALSIMFVAGEIAHARAGAPGLTARAPWLVAFAFGLLHGLGFAGALREVGLPEQAIPLALLFFNLGVELGQLAFVVAALAAVALARRVVAAQLHWAEPLAAYGIGGTAAYWAIERVAAFWP
jgi:hydrogenase/urease accessory protein HupE